MLKKQEARRGLLIFLLLKIGLYEGRESYFSFCEKEKNYHVVCDVLLGDPVLFDVVVQKV
jgi:hypothetical protein